MSLTSSITPLFTTPRFSAKSSALHFQFAISNSCRSSNIVLSFSSSSYGFCCRAIPTTSTPSPYGAPTKAHQHWMVLVEPPPQGFTSRSQIINYYVKTLERVLGRFLLQPYHILILLKMLYLFTCILMISFMKFGSLPMEFEDGQNTYRLSELNCWLPQCCRFPQPGMLGGSD
ncbi:unnamed protein product [Cuscuta epithymum]|uniref:MORF/ORRM1/DAG-like MORF domain-containing protein n=1 Tax=Cuscuta epithymum TaxID=186058 RepID=A0AAV0EH10_9ASTE|nr:unnamed protein product [Cuscuta epithymum]